MTTTRQRATARLVSTIAQHRHPSHQLLDRLEGSLRTAEDLEAYAYVLDRLIEGQRYPSLRMLDRLDRCALAREWVELFQHTDDEEHDE